VTFELPSRWSGKKVGWLEEEYGLRVAYLEGVGDGVEIPGKNTAMKGGASVTLLAPEKGVRRLERALIRDAGRSVLKAGRKWMRDLVWGASGRS
ncbi:MAG: hypothetical protein WHT46_08200, partial [Candidatus Geothermincolales bacterium]